MERDILKISNFKFNEGTAMRYSFIHREFRRHPLTMHCQVLRVNRSGYYAAHPVHRGLHLLYGMLGLIAFLVLGGCISIDRTSTGDVLADERYENAISEILKDSDKAVKQILQASVRKNIDSDLRDYVGRHFAKADDIVSRHTLNFLEHFPFVMFDDFLKKRKILLEHTTKIKVSLEIIYSDNVSAIAFPNGTVILTTRLIESFSVDEGTYDSALLGVLIHELVHVRDGHAIEQWATADGRKQIIGDKVLKSLSYLTALIPFLSITYDMDYGTSFASASYLSQLSEYAADFGAVSLLFKNGFEKEEYISFLDEVHFNSRKSVKLSEVPFSWIHGRVNCLQAFREIEFNKKFPQIVVGSQDAGDGQMQFFDFNKGIDLTVYLDDPVALRELIPLKKLSGVNYTDQQLRDWLIQEVQASIFIVCSIENTFADYPIYNNPGSIQTPGFDVNLFFQFLTQT